jgi:transposase-like protein
MYQDNPTSAGRIPMPAASHARDGESLAAFACPNPDCKLFNQFNAGNLSICERMGKDKAIRRLYCKACGHRFSERQGSLMAYSKLSEPVVVRIVKCLGHGCSIEATADICEVDPRTVARLAERAGLRANDFHRLQVERLRGPLAAVQLDELHGRVYRPPRKKGDRHRRKRLRRKASGVQPPGGLGPDAPAAASPPRRDTANWAETGSTPHWRCPLVF